MSNIYNTIGKNIKKYRKLKGWTQRELAEKLLLSDSEVELPAPVCVAFE